MAQRIVRIEVCRDCKGTRWWTALRRSTERTPEMATLRRLTRVDALLVPRARAAAIVAAAAGLPGWCGGPHGARHPLFVIDAEEIYDCPLCGRVV